MKNVYDNEVFFEEYQKTRANEINANNLIEIPIMKEMLPAVKDKSILDLGCGAGDMDKYFVEKGAKYVLATDISENMINVANAINGHEKISYKVLKMEDIENIQEKFDIVYSSLAFHYIEDFNKLLSDINHLLNPNGILIFSTESPINMASSKYHENDERKYDVGDNRYFIIDNYCKEGERQVWWNNTLVTKYHRTYATLVNLLIKNNFEILEIKDSFASPEAIELCPKYRHQIGKPYFTFIKAIKK